MASRIELPAINPDNTQQDDPAENQPALIDVKRSARLSEVFLRAVPEQLDKLDTGNREGNAQEVRAHAHKLKGSALSLGAMRVARLSEAIQFAAGAGELRRTPEWIERTKAEFEAVRTALQDELKRASG